jgi:hypothetical protein
MVAGGEAKRNHRLIHKEITSPGRASDSFGLTPFQGLNYFFRPTGGYASLHLRLPSIAPPALRNSPAKSGMRAYPGRISFNLFLD